ncbi:MAG: hypothetical protein ABW318_10185 [Vicinamibacterales bacterium]
MKRLLVSASVGVVIGALSVSAPTAIRAASRQDQTKRVNPNAQAIANFQKRVEEYAKLHRKLESTIPPLPKEATPEQIDAHQRALGRLIQQARKNEAAGAIFDRDVRPVFRRLLHGLFTGPDGKKLREAIMDENPGESVKLAVNGRYPDTIPLSSVPPQILKALPPLPDELEYRFIQNSLILLDVHAHIIVDYLTAAVPR